MDLPDSGQITWGEYEWRRPTSVSLPGGASKSFNLDPLQRIKEITTRDPAGNTVLRREYDYDKAGNIISEQTGEGRHDYGYDPLNRLTQAENPALPNEEYSYDAVGNRLTSADTNGTWSYNSNNELLAYNNATCTFDENGDMVKRVVEGKVTRYTYNANNRLTRVEDGSGDVIARYYYDPFGRRLWKEVNGERTYFHYSEQGLIAEYDDQGDPIRFYGYKPGSNWTTDPLFLKKDGSYYFYHNDHLGTSQKLTASNGKVVWSARYASFGETQLVEQEITNPLRFPGQYYDRETRLHYNYHRYYDVQVGRYLREDPIEFESEDVKFYAYVQNNPINNIDHLGLYTWSGSGDDVGGFLLFGGASTTYGFVTNWNTGEKCQLEIRCYKLGIVLGGGVTAKSIWITNGPKCGKNLSGVSVGGGLEGGLGGYFSGSPAGTVGVSEVGPQGQSGGFTGGAGIGAGGAMYAFHCTTRVMSCKNTPCKCK